MEGINIGIVEDDGFVAEHLSQILTEIGLKRIRIANNKRQFQQLFDTENFHLFLLDIRMEESTTGIQIAEQLKGKVPFIFITAHSDPNTLQQATQLIPEGYILKPFNPNQIKATIMAVLAKLANQGVDTFHFKSGYSEVSIKKQDILFIKADNIYCHIHTPEKRYLIRQSLKQLLSDLNFEDLQRVHRSYAVNQQHVTETSTKHFVVAGTTVPRGKNVQ